MATQRKDETAQQFRERMRPYKREWKAQHRLITKGTSTLYRGDTPVARWDKTRLQGRAPADVYHLPDPKVVSKVSTLYDQLGDVSQQWITERPEAVQQRDLWLLWAKELAQPLPRATPTLAPTSDAASDLCAVYPVGDHHLGMLAWHQETDADYDIEIGTRLLTSAVDYLVNLSPHCGQAVVAFLGDFMHYDSFESVTPTNRNPLDADGRFPKMVRAARLLMQNTIERVAQHHQNVTVIVESGNHDPASSVFLREALCAIYENDPRITIDTSPKNFHYYRIGNNLLGTHHGHGVKADQLPLIMATDRPEDWGATKYRMWLTGHVHHESKKDYPGCTVESYRVLPPSDAWAANRGYRAPRGMKALILNSDYGETARYTAPAEMFNC